MAMSASPACFNAHGVLTTPDGSFSFASPSGKSKAEILFAKVGDVWIAEYRFRFLCGLYHGSTLPLSVNSESFPVQGKGITLCASSGGSGRQTGLYLVGGKPRRLTPRECAWMQGFPESFKPHPSASQACKQFGNSVAVPVVAAIAAAAAAVL